MLNLLWVIVVLKAVMKDTNMNVSSLCHFVETKDEKYLLDCYPSSVCQCRIVLYFIIQEALVNNSLKLIYLRNSTTFFVC